MEEDKRHQKLKAGKEKLAQFQRKKRKKKSGSNDERNTDPTTSDSGHSVNTSASAESASCDMPQGDECPWSPDSITATSPSSEKSYSDKDGASSIDTDFPDFNQISMSSYNQNSESNTNPLDSIHETGEEHASKGVTKHPEETKANDKIAYDISTDPTNHHTSDFSQSNENHHTENMSHKSSDIGDTTTMNTNQPSENLSDTNYASTDGETQANMAEMKELLHEVQWLQTQLCQSNNMLQTQCDQQHVSLQALQKARGEISSLQEVIAEKDKLVTKLAEKITQVSTEYGALKEKQNTPDYSAIEEKRKAPKVGKMKQNDENRNNNGLSHLPESNEDNSENIEASLEIERDINEEIEKIVAIKDSERDNEIMTIKDSQQAEIKALVEKQQAEVECLKEGHDNEVKMLNENHERDSCAAEVEIARMRAEIAALYPNIRNFQSENETLTTDNATLTRELKSTREENEKLAREVNSLTASVQEVNETNEKLAAEKAEFQNLVKSLEDDLAHSAEEKGLLNGQLEELNMNIKALQEELSESNERVKELGDFNEVLEVQNAAIVSRNDGLESEKMALCLEMENMKGDMLILSEENAKLSDDNENCKTSIADYEAKMSELRALTEENDSLHVQNDDLNNKINNQKDVIATLRADTDVQSKENTDLMSQLTDLATGFQLFEKQNTDLRTEKEVLNVQVADLKNQLQQINSENENYKHNQNLLEDEIQALKGELAGVVTKSESVKVPITEVFQAEDIEKCLAGVIESQLVEEKMVLEHAIEAATACAAQSNIESTANNMLDSSSDNLNLVPVSENFSKVEVTENLVATQPEYPPRIHSELPSSQIPIVTSEVFVPEDLTHSDNSPLCHDIPTTQSPTALVNVDTGYDSIVPKQDSVLSKVDSRTVTVETQNQVIEPDSEMLVEHLQLALNTVREALRMKTEECEQSHDTVQTLRKFIESSKGSTDSVEPSIVAVDSNVMNNVDSNEATSTVIDNSADSNDTTSPGNGKCETESCKPPMDCLRKEVSANLPSSATAEQEVNLHASSSPGCHGNNVVDLASSSSTLGNVLPGVIGDSSIVHIGDDDDGLVNFQYLDNIAVSRTREIQSEHPTESMVDGATETISNDLQSDNNIAEATVDNASVTETMDLYSKYPTEADSVSSSGTGVSSAQESSKDLHCDNLTFDKASKTKENLVSQSPNERRSEVTTYSTAQSGGDISNDQDSGELTDIKTLNVLLKEQLADMEELMAATSERDEALQNELFSEKEVGLKLRKESENVALAMSQLQGNLLAANKDLKETESQLEELKYEHEKVAWEKKVFEEKSDDLEKLVLEIKAEKCDLEFQKEQFSEDLHRAKDRLEYLESSDNDLIEIKEMLERIQDERENGVRENEQLQCKLSVQLEENEKLIETMDSLHKENADLLKNFKKVNTGLEETRAEFGDTKAKKEKLEVEVESLTKSKEADTIRYTSEIEGLVEENSTLKTNMQMKELDIETLKSEIDELNSKLNSAIPEEGSIDSKGDAPDATVLKAKVDELEGKLSEMSRDNENLVTELMDVQNTLLECGSEIEWLNNKCEEYQRIVDDLDDEKTELLDSVDRINGEMSTKQQENSVIVERLELQLESLDQENSTLKTMVMLHEDDSKSKVELEKDNQQLTQGIEDMRAKVVELEKLLRKERGQGNTGEGVENVGQLDDQVKELSEENSLLKQKCASFEHDLVDVRKSENSLREQIKTYEEVLNSEREGSDAMVTVDQLKSQLELEKRFKTKLQKDIENVQAHVEALENENRELNNTVSDKSRVISDNQKELQRMDTSLNKANTGMKTLVEENENCKIRNQELGKKVAEQVTENRGLTDEVNQLNTNLQLISCNRDHLRTQVEILAAEIDRLSELADLRMLECHEKDRIVQELQREMELLHSGPMSEPEVQTELEQLHGESKTEPEATGSETTESENDQSKPLNGGMNSQVESESQDHPQASVPEQQATVPEANKLNEHLKFENKKLRDQIDELKKTIEINMQTLEIDRKITEDNDRLMSENESLQVTNESLLVEKDELQECVDSFKERLRRVDELMEKYKEHCDSSALTERVKELNNRIVEAQREKDDLHKVTDELTNTLHDMQTKYEEVKSEMESTKKRCDKEICQLQNQLEEMNSDVSELRKMLNYMENEMYSTTEEKEQLKETLEQTQSEFANVVDQKQQLEERLNTEKQQKDLKNMKMVSQRQNQLLQTQNDDTTAASTRNSSNAPEVRPSENNVPNSLGSTSGPSVNNMPNMRQTETCVWDSNQSCIRVSNQSCVRDLNQSDNSIPEITLSNNTVPVISDTNVEDDSIEDENNIFETSAVEQLAEAITAMSESLSDLNETYEMFEEQEDPVTSGDTVIPSFESAFQMLDLRTVDDTMSNRTVQTNLSIGEFETTGFLLDDNGEAMFENRKDMCLNNSQTQTNWLDFDRERLDSGLQSPLELDDTETIASSIYSEHSIYSEELCSNADTIVDMLDVSCETDVCNHTEMGTQTDHVADVARSKVGDNQDISTEAVDMLDVSSETDLCNHTEMGIQTDDVDDVAQTEEGDNQDTVIEANASGLVETGQAVVDDSDREMLQKHTQTLMTEETTEPIVTTVATTQTEVDFDNIGTTARTTNCVNPVATNETQTVITVGASELENIEQEDKDSLTTDQDRHGLTIDQDGLTIAQEDRHGLIIAQNISMISNDSGVASAAVMSDDRNIYTFGSEVQETKNLKDGDNEKVDQMAQTDLDIEKEVKDKVEAMQAELETDIEQRVLKQLEFRVAKIQGLENNYEKKVKQMEYDIEEKFEQKFRVREVEVVLLSERGKKAHAEEVDRDAKRRIERVKMETNQQFMEMLQKVKADFDKRLKQETHRNRQAGVTRQAGSETGYRQTDDVRVAPSRRAESGDGMATADTQDMGPYGDEEMAALKLLQAENQELASARDELLRKIDGNQQDQDLLHHQLLCIMGEHNSTMDNNSKPAKAPKPSTQPSTQPSTTGAFLDWDLAPELSFDSVRSSIDAKSLSGSLDPSSFCVNSDCLAVKMKYEHLIEKIQQFLKMKTNMGLSNDAQGQVTTVEGDVDNYAGDRSVKQEVDHADRFVESQEDEGQILQRITSIHLEHFVRCPKQEEGAERVGDQFVHETESNDALDDENTIRNPNVAAAANNDIVDMIVSECVENIEGHFSETEIDQDLRQPRDVRSKRMPKKSKKNKRARKMKSKKSIPVTDDGHFSEEDEMKGPETRKRFFSESDITVEVTRPADDTSRSDNAEGQFVFERSDSVADVMNGSGESDVDNVEPEDVFPREFSMENASIAASNDSPRSENPNNRSEDALATIEAFIIDEKPPGSEEIILNTRTEGKIGEETGDFFEENQGIVRPRSAEKQGIVRPRSADTKNGRKGRNLPSEPTEAATAETEHIASEQFDSGDILETIAHSIGSAKTDSFILELNDIDKDDAAVLSVGASKPRKRRKVSGEVFVKEKTSNVASQIGDFCETDLAPPRSLSPVRDIADVVPIVEADLPESAATFDKGQRSYENAVFDILNSICPGTDPSRRISARTQTDTFQPVNKESADTKSEDSTNDGNEANVDTPDSGQQMLRHLENENKALHEKLKSIKSVHEDVENENAQLKSKLAELETKDMEKLESIKSVNVDMENENAQLKSKLAKLATDSSGGIDQGTTSNKQDKAVIASLNEDLRLLAEELEDKTYQLTVLQCHVSDLEQEIATAEDVRSELEDMETKKMEVEKRLKSDLKNMDTLKKEAENRLEKEHDENQALKHAVESTENEVKSIQETNDSLRKELDNYIDENKSLLKASEEYTSISELQDELKDEVQRLTDENKSLNEASEKYTSLSKLQDEMKDEVQRLTAEKDELKSTLEKERSRLSSEKEELEEALLLHDEINIKLEQKLERIRNDNSQLSVQLENEHSRNDELNANVALLKSEKDLLNAEVEKFQIENEEFLSTKKEKDLLNAEVERLRTENEGLLLTEKEDKQSISELKAEKEMANEQLKELKEQNHASEEILVNKAEEIDQLTASNGDFAKQVDALNERLASLQPMVVELERQVGSLTDENSVLKERDIELDGELDSAKRKMVTLQSENKTITESLDNSKSVAESYCKENARLQVTVQELESRNSDNEWALRELHEQLANVEKKGPAIDTNVDIEKQTDVVAKTPPNTQDATTETDTDLLESCNVLMRTVEIPPCTQDASTETDIDLLESCNMLVRTATDVQMIDDENLAIHTQTDVHMIDIDNQKRLFPIENDDAQLTKYCDAFVQTEQAHEGMSKLAQAEDKSINTADLNEAIAAESGGLEQLKLKVPSFDQATETRDMNQTEDKSIDTTDLNETITSETSGLELMKLKVPSFDQATETRDMEEWLKHGSVNRLEHSELGSDSSYSISEIPHDHLDVPEVLSLREELDMLKTENVALKEKIDSFDARSDSDTDLQILQDMRDAIKSLKTEKADIERQKSEVSDTLEKDQKRLQCDVEELLAENDMLRKKLKAQEETLKRENSEVLRMYNDLRNEVEVLVISKHDLEIELHALKDLLEQESHMSFDKTGGGTAGGHDTSRELTIQDLEEMSELKSSIEKLKVDLKEKDTYVRKLEEHLLGSEKGAMPSLTSTPRASVNNGGGQLLSSTRQNLMAETRRRAYSHDIPSLTLRDRDISLTSRDGGTADGKVSEIRKGLFNAYPHDESLHDMESTNREPTTTKLSPFSDLGARSRTSSVGQSLEVSDRIRSGLKADEDGHLALELKQFELVAEIATLRRDLRETKAVYSHETSLLNDALENERLAKDSRDRSGSFRVSSNMSHDLLKLRKEVSVYKEENRVLKVDNDRWIERLKEQEGIVLDLKERLNRNTSGYGEIEEVFGRQLALLQKQREELVDRLKDRENEFSTLSMTLGEKGIIEETLRNEKSVLMVKLENKEAIEKELGEKKLLVQKQKARQAELEDVIYRKDMSEIELMKQKRLLEAQLKEIESKFRDKEEILDHEKNELLQELKEKSRARKSLFLESDNDDTSSVSSVCSESAVFSDRNIGRLEIMLEQVEHQHSVAVNVLRDQLRTRYNRREKDLRKGHSEALVKLRNTSKKQVN